jgi:8-oxo-dGTP pyrophosphatase MutT (NUDIX family)
MSSMSLRDVRHQAAVVRDHHVLLIRVHDHDGDRSFWLCPGGGAEGEEDGFACVQREIMEEANLAVEVERLLWEDDGGGVIYNSARTYLCRPIGEPSPGVEPEVEFNSTITDVGWFDLRSFDNWHPDIVSDSITMRWIHSLRAILGYKVALDARSQSLVSSVPRSSTLLR